ncbi:MAG: hypothetical protein KKF48_01425 [Nanoarchaeota archaeon]|nr:hypothetical protein [Nanoarchaeota archaeon]MBU1027683.1 hypothetical protein [Nanoarchaeota archaeon]
MGLNESLIYALPQELVGKVSVLLTILQALGGVIILYVIFGVISLVINRKKNKQIELINKNLEEIKVLLYKK